MNDVLPTDPVDKHDAPGMAQWLRTRVQANRDLAQNARNADGLIVLEKWRENLLPHIAFRLEQAADMIDHMSVRLREAIAFVKLHATTERWAWIRKVESELSDDVPAEPQKRRHVAINPGVCPCPGHPLNCHGHPNTCACSAPTRG